MVSWLPFGQEYFIISPVGFKENLSLLELCLFFPGDEKAMEVGVLERSHQPQLRAQLRLLRSGQPLGPPQLASHQRGRGSRAI